MQSCDAIKYAIRLLAKRDMSTWEISQKLKSKGYLSDTIQNTLSILIDEKYLNDLTLAERKLQALMFSGKYGCKFITTKLRQQYGFSESIIVTVLPILNNYNEKDQAYQLVMKKFDGEEIADTSKISRFLARRGFSSASIYYVLDQITQLDTN